MPALNAVREPQDRPFGSARGGGYSRELKRKDIMHEIGNFLPGQFLRPAVFIVRIEFREDFFQCPCAAVVEIRGRAPSLSHLEEEIRIYYGGSDWLHTDWRNAYLCLATLRPDGFAGFEQESKDKPAIITTVPIPFAGQSLQVTADVEKNGSVKVTILDKSGREISLAETVSMTVTDGRLKLTEEINEDRIRIRFELNGAKLYSFSFGG